MPNYLKWHSYDGIEIMGSEGYLINQFIVEHTNRRKDKWEDLIKTECGSLSPLLSQSEALGEDFIIIYRLSMLDLIKREVHGKRSLSSERKLKKLEPPLLIQE